MVTIMSGIQGEEEDEQEERQKQGYLSFSKKHIRDNVRETAAQHQHHTLLAVCYTRHLEMRDITTLLYMPQQDRFYEVFMKERVS